MQLTFIKIRLLFRSQFYDNKVHDKDANAEKPLGIKTFILILLSVATFYKAKKLFYVWKGDEEKELH